MEIQFTVDREGARFELPGSVQKRLDTLLNRQDRGEPLDEEERREAEGLVEIVEFLSLLRLRTRNTRNA